MDGNVNENYEQEMMLRKKIEKREKTDTILAYILIVVLVVCIGMVLYLKFGRKEDNNPIDEYVPNYISLSDISSLLNKSTLVNNYVKEGATFSSNVSGNSIVVTYTKDDVVLNLNIPVVSNELVVTIPSDNNDIATDIYKEVTNIICVYYGNDEDSCRNTINNITIEDNSISGIRYGDNNTVYIDMTRSIDLIIDTAIRTSVNSIDYSVTSLDIKISKVNVTSSDDNIVVSGNIERISDNKDAFSVVVKLYDINGNVLDENNLEYTEEDSLEDGLITISLMPTDYTFEDVSEYSIEIVE